MLSKPLMPRYRARGGFTLVELLLVVVILGIVAVIAAPRVGPLLAGGQLRMGAREIVSVGRYARTMALMNQTPVDVIIQQGTGRIEIRAREVQSANVLGMSDVAALTNATGYTDSLIETSARRRASLSGGFGIAISREERDATAWRDDDAMKRQFDVSVDDHDIAVSDTVTFQDSINMTREVQGVKIWFEGYCDTVESRSAYSRVVYGDATPTEGDEVVLRYRANGTVRPHEIVLRSEKHAEDFMRVTVNAVGTAKVVDGVER